MDHNYCDEHQPDPQPLAPIIDNLGMCAALGPNDHVTAAIVLAKVVNFETGDVFLGYYRSDGLDWMDARGMLGAAGDVASAIGSIGAFDDMVEDDEE